MKTKKENTFPLWLQLKESEKKQPSFKSHFMFFGTSIYNFDRDMSAAFSGSLCARARPLSLPISLFCTDTHTHTLIISGHTIIWLLLCAAHQFSYFCISELGERANGRVWLALVTQFSMFDASCDENAWPFLFVRLCIMHVLCKLNFDKNSKNEHTQIQIHTHTISVNIQA